MLAAAAMMVTWRWMLSLMSLNFWQCRPDMTNWVMKYCVLSLWQNAKPSSISYCSAMHVSSTFARWPLRPASAMTFSTLRTFAQKIFASCLSACTSADACTTPATRNAIGATHGSSFPKARSALPAAPAISPMAPRAPSFAAPATRAAVPTAVVTAAAASTAPVSKAASFPSP